MPNFLKYLFASCLGTVLAIIVLFFIGSTWLVGLATKLTDEKKAHIGANSVLKLDFKNPIPERTNNLEMSPFETKNKDIVGLTDMVYAIEKAKNDPDIKGIYLNTSMMQAGKATSSVLRKSLEDFRTSGKFVYAYSNYYSQSAYYLASAADSILLNPIGLVDFRGLGATYSYFKNMLDRLDVQMRIFYAGKFKSATEPFRMEKMSDENRLQVRQYVNGMYDIFISDISKSRKIPETDLRNLAETYQGRDADLALKSRLVDRLAYEDEVFSAMKSRIGLDEKTKLNLVSIEDYFSAKHRDLDLNIKDKIAVVYLEGQISDGNSGQAGEIFDGKVVKDLRKIREDDKIKAVVLRVNSPGGSVMASENILREVELIKKSGRPVIVSMGDLAASGGYYISCKADSIFAEPNTITGSIGVFGMIPILDKTMKNKLGITYDSVRTGKYSTFGTPFFDFSPEEGQMIQAGVDKIYADFLKKVAVGRGKTPEQIHEIAQGRVWTGVAAKANGLVDDLGGLDRAISAAAKKAGLEKYRTTEFPKTKKGLEQFIEKFTDEEDPESVNSYFMKRELGEYYPVFEAFKNIKKMQGLQARLPDVFILN